MARFAPVRVEVKMMEVLVVRETIAALTAERDAALARLSALEAKVEEAVDYLDDGHAERVKRFCGNCIVRAILTRDEGGDAAAMDDFAANTTHGGTWIERDEGGDAT